MLALDIGASGMLAQQTNVEVISNNIANMSTVGYKRQRTEFQDLIYQNRTRPGSTSSDAGDVIPAGIQVGLGVKTGSVYRINEQGSFQVTDNPLDLMINGRGFFQVERPDGQVGYTRNGQFQVNEDGELVTSDGFRIEPNIVIPEDAVEIDINRSGEVLVRIEDQIDLQNVGQIEIAAFQNPAGLEAIGDNLFLETEASGNPILDNPAEAGFGQIEQGVLESSNVDIVQEITSLITAQRAYEMNSNVIRTADEMANTTGQLR